MLPVYHTLDSVPGFGWVTKAYVGQALSLYHYLITELSSCHFCICWYDNYVNLIRPSGRLYFSLHRFESGYLYIYAYVRMCLSRHLNFCLFFCVCMSCRFSCLSLYHFVHVFVSIPVSTSVSLCILLCLPHAQRFSAFVCFSIWVSLILSISAFTCL